MPVLAQHTKSFNLVDTLSVGVDRIQRNFEPMQRQVESSRKLRSAMAKRSWSSTPHLLMASSTLRRACCLRFTVRTSSRSIRSSHRKPCGACRTRSQAHSRSSIWFRSSRRRRSWANFSTNCRL